MANIAVIDDESLMRDLISTSLRRLGHEVDTSERGDGFLKSNSGVNYDMVITDLKMPGMSGLELAEELLNREPGMPIILMTAYGTVDAAVKAMKLGVQDFIEKPFQVERLEHVVTRVLELRGLQRENQQLKANLEKHYKFIGKSDVIQELMGMVEEVAGSKSTVLISGESGTGKELIAHAIHNKSRRFNEAFVKINCAAIPENLVESELFGHEKGAYTGAVKTRIGKFEEAHQGTILLDEISEMPLSAQSKLLRILQENELNKIGSNASITVDVRVICTTNRQLEKEVREGNFREDLYYRLNVIPIKLPPLRERKEDIPLLCGHFTEKYNRENGFHVPGVSEEALGFLLEHNWPGNVRELENVIQRAVVFSKFETIEKKHLKFFERRSTVRSGSELFSGMTIAEGEKLLILKTLKACGDNRTKAAGKLDISVRTLRNKLKEYQINE